MAGDMQAMWDSPGASASMFTSQWFMKECFIFGVTQALRDKHSFHAKAEAVVGKAWNWKLWEKLEKYERKLGSWLAKTELEWMALLIQSGKKE
jgi:hypothetical protein